MEEQTKQSLLNVDTWIRLVYMLVFSLLLCIARIVLFGVAILQFVFLLFTGSANDNLRDLGQIAAKWVLQVFYFITFNSEQKPFPFDEWPELDKPANSSDKTTQSSMEESSSVAEGSNSSVAEEDTAGADLSESGDDSDKSPKA